MAPRTTMMILRTLFVFITAGLLWASVTTAYAGGPWPRDVGRLFTSTYYFLYAADRGWNAEGTVMDFPNDGRYAGHTIGVYWEYGLTSRWTLQGNVPFVVDRYEDRFIDESNAAFSDVTLAARYHLGDAPVVSSVHVGATVPWLYGNERPERGFGEPGLEAGAAAGRGFGGAVTGWWSLEGAFRYYFGDPVPQLRYQALLGVDLHDDWSVIGQFNGVQALGEGEFSERLNPLVQEGYTFVRAQATIVRHLSEAASLQAGVYKDLLGRSFGVGQGITAALWLEL